MPLHDWTRVAHNVFHAFHLHWMSEFSGLLNDGLLPPGYFARPEEYVGTFEADVLTVEAGGASTTEAETAAPPGAGLTPTATIAPPRIAAWKDRRIAVFSARDERRVSVIEIVSPGNKDSERRARTFEEKILICLASGLHVLIVDLLPETNAAPGFGAAVARELGSSAVPPAGRCATSFECRPSPAEVRVYHQSLQLGVALPGVPLFLEPDRHVMLPLETAYAGALRRLPAPDRGELESA